MEVLGKWVHFISVIGQFVLVFVVPSMLQVSLVGNTQGGGGVNQYYLFKQLVITLLFY